MCVRISVCQLAGFVCRFWLQEILLVHAFKSTVRLAITMLALLIRTNSILWDKCWQRRTLDACSRAVCGVIPLISIWWHSTRHVLRLWWSINLFSSVLELETNWILVKGARLNCFFLKCQWKCLSLPCFLRKIHLKKRAYMIVLCVRLSGTCRQSPHCNQFCQKVEGVPSHPSTLLVSFSFVKKLTSVHWC